MSGSARGSWGSSKFDPGQTKREIDRVSSNVDNQVFSQQVSGYLDSLLAIFNDRDSGDIKNKIDEIKRIIGDACGGTIDTSFGGSVSKHTYVDGLSDVDCLLMVDGTKLENKTPTGLINYVFNKLQQNISDIENITTGKMAVTIKYKNGLELQVLPAIRTEEGIKVPSGHADTWSAIQPENFTNALSRRNSACNMKLIPTIKLAKAINSTLPEQAQLSGYHMEALAINAFRGYSDSCVVSKMLPHFFRRSAELVLKPIQDKTGQSVNVDDNLGKENSPERIKISHIFNRIAKRMDNANNGASIEQWQSMFGD